MTLWVFRALTLPCHPPEATHAAGSVPHIYTKGDSLSSICGGGVPGLALGLVGGGGSAGSVLRSQGTLGPAKLSRWPREGNQGVDVPMLAPARSRCRFVEAQESSGKMRRSECPNGAPHTSPG